VALTAVPAFAQLPAARLNAVFPPGAKAGASVDVIAHGIDLDGATKLQFSHPGITAEKTDASRDTAKFTVKVAKDVPPGNYDCRIAGKFGISNPRVFVVGDREEADAKPGASAGNAGKLPLDRTVYAHTTSNVIDFWSFEATKGQRLMIECDARAIDSHLSPSLMVVDAAGRELARSRRTGFLDFTAPEAATYTLRVSDMLYRGGPEYFYRLCISTGPHIDSVFPPAGHAGSKGTFTLLGRNLPGGKKTELKAADGNPLESLDVQVELPKDPSPERRLETAGLIGPSGAGLDGFAYRLASPVGLSNAVGIVYVDSDVIREADATSDSAAKDAPDKAQQITLPATVAGRLAQRNDRDWYTFEAKKGDVYYIDTIADRLNQPMAVSVSIRRADDAADAKPVVESADDETNLGSPAFRTATRDPILKWDVQKDGVYRLCVRDKFGVSTSDPTRQYIVSIRKPQPDFQVVATPMSGSGADAALWNTLLRKGGSAPLRISVLRQDGFAGDVKIETEGLPKGVECTTPTIPGGESSGIVIFTTTSDASNWSGTIKLTARSKLDDHDISRAVRCGTVVWGQLGDGKNQDPKNSLDPVTSRMSRDLALGVYCDEADPLTIRPAEEKVYEVQQGTKVSIPLTIKKTTEFKQALKLKLVGTDAKNAKDVTVEPSADKATLDLDLAQMKLPPGTYSLCLASAAQIKYMRPDEPSGSESGGKNKGKKSDGKDASITVYSAPITFTVTPAPEKKKKG
jgi:hypothetical protein